MHSELFHKVRDIEFAARHEVLDKFAGMYLSAFKGQGIELDDIREYQNGDDPRSIAWKKTAHMGRPFVKTFREERDLTVLICADVSGSCSFGSHYETKRERLAQVGALLAFAAIHNHDRVGLMLFSDHVEKMILPKRGTRHGARLVRELLAFQPKGVGTDIGRALDVLNKAIPKRAICFLLSDFIADNFEQELAFTAKKDDLVAIRIVDTYESKLLPMGLAQFQDIESKITWLVNLHSEQVNRYEEEANRQKKKVDLFLAKSNAGLIEIDTKEEFVEKIIAYFSLRKKFAR